MWEMRTMRRMDANIVLFNLFVGLVYINKNLKGN